MSKLPAGGENWNRAYEDAPEVFDAFSRAEDPDGIATRRLLALAALDGRTVLEVGCGTGRYTGLLAPRARRYVATEPSPRMLALAREHCAGIARRPALVRARGEALPFPAASVDTIVAAFVLVHLRPAIRRAVYRELLRVLVPARDGGVWLLENHWEGEFQRLRGQSGRAEDAEIRPVIDSCGVPGYVESIPQSRVAAGLQGW